MFYIFAIIFGFAYGGEVPQLPVLINRYFGNKSLGVLSGILMSSALVGAALGSVGAGILFDITQSYQMIFPLIIALNVIALILLIFMRKSSQKSLSV